jgi:hypothetical protein
LCSLSSSRILDISRRIDGTKELQQDRGFSRGTAQWIEDEHESLTRNWVYPAFHLHQRLAKRRVNRLLPRRYNGSANLESAPMQSIAQLVNVANQAPVTFILCSGELVFVRHFAERIPKQVQVACITEKTPNLVEFG